jgi:short subunit dehydrogenase-like uncharacterized protein
MGPLAVLGATGYTGGLVLEQARALGLPLRLVGRRAERLSMAARPGEEIRVADARDADALSRAFEGAAVVASVAGPFLELGTAPLEAALEAGAHWVDTSGEQAFARLVYERFSTDAEQRGLVVLTSFGFDYVPGDLAARIAAEGLEPLDEIAVGYSVKGFASSAGTRRTLGHVLSQPQVAYVDGRLVASRFGATSRRVHFPFGERTAVEWGGTEPLTVPRHTRVRTVRSYVRAPALTARAVALAPLAVPFARAAGTVGGGPSERRRARNRFAVVAEAHGPAGARRATVAGRDVYGLTALLVAVAADTLRRGEARGAGVLAAAEAFDARTLAARLAPLLELADLVDL